MGTNQTAIKCLLSFLNCLFQTLYVVNEMFLFELELYMTNRQFLHNLNK